MNGAAKSIQSAAYLGHTCPWILPRSREMCIRDRSVALFHILKGENPDFFGWLSIPDTLLDYPVMYTPCDPGYYLRRAFDGDESVSGVPFVLSLIHISQEYRRVTQSITQFLSEQNG